MFPWRSVIQVQQPGPVPVYVQIANAIIGEIKEGRVQPGARLPGTRAMSKLLDVHRKTVVAAFEELDAQGWIEIHPSKGAFVNTLLPEMKPQPLISFKSLERSPEVTAGFEVEPYANAHQPSYAPSQIPGLHDGPDMRLVPTALIARTYKGVLTRKTSIPHLRYNEVDGNPNLRRTLSEYVNESRGLQTTPDNIFITRGSQMGMFLTGMALLKPGDLVVSGDPGYYYAERTFTHFGAEILRIPTDHCGLQTEAIEKICQHRPVRMVYVTPHHHFPTTVTLCAPRRMELLALSEKYRFAILEDDYDYDFHYESSPLLPLASADREGMVIYIGSLSKTFAPALRVGFMVAPLNLIGEISRMRQIIDVQGDWVLEQTFSELFRLGEIKRHMKKALKVYRHRRDVFCEMLAANLGEKVHFKIPEGGMAVWAQFDPKYPLPEVAQKAKQQGLVISNGLIHDKASDYAWNSTRLGFASVNEAEMERAFGILKKIMR